MSGSFSCDYTSGCSHADSHAGIAFDRKINFKVHGWARYDETASRCGSVVVLYTVAGHVQFDGVAMTFDEVASGAFSRAGFHVSARRRRGRRSESGSTYTLTGIHDVIGMFKFVSELDTSSLECGDDIPNVENNPFENATEILYTEHMLYSCGPDVETDRVACPNGGEIVDVLGNSYYKRERVTYGKIIEGQWFTVSHTTIPEAPAGLQLVEVSDGSSTTAYTIDSLTDACSYPRSHDKAMMKGFSSSPSKPDPKDYTMRFVGYDVVNGVYVRHYKLILNNVVDQLVASAAKAGANFTVEHGEHTGEMSMFEHYDENRLYGLFVAAPSHLGTFESIISDPTEDEISSAGLGGYTFPVDTTDSVTFLKAPSTCLSIQESVEQRKVDVALYNSGAPYSVDDSDAAIDEQLAQIQKVKDIDDMYQRAKAALNATAPDRRDRRGTGSLVKLTGAGGIVDTSPPSIELGGGNSASATNLGECVGECDADSQCKSGLKCFQRSHGELIPGCHGLAAKDWDFCYDPAKDDRGTLGGGNSASATNLQPCVGECDADSQCAGSYKCFQRNGKAPVPGCKGGGTHDWDYCYDPAKAQGPFSVTVEHYLEDRWFRHIKMAAGASTCLPGICGNPKITVEGSLYAALSEKVDSNEVGMSASIKVYASVYGISGTITCTFSAGIKAEKGMYLKGGVKLGVGVGSIEPSITGYWLPVAPPMPRTPSEVEIGVEVCGFWVCGSLSVSTRSGPLG